MALQLTAEDHSSIGAVLAVLGEQAEVCRFSQLGPMWNEVAAELSALRDEHVSVLPLAALR
jgi:hypothetical protein